MITNPTMMIPLNVCISYIPLFLLISYQIFDAIHAKLQYSFYVCWINYICNFIIVIFMTIVNI